jgi:acyl transferase domain-containing protein
VALFELLGSWGVRPCATIGHSAGEPCAAYASGALSLEETVRLVFHRSRLQQELAGCVQRSLNMVPDVP